MAYRQEREINERFVATVLSWIEGQDEVFIVLRYLHGAGSKDYLFCRAAEEFPELINSLPPGTEVIVFRDPQLTLRGVVSDLFRKEALGFILDGAEYLMIWPNPPGLRTLFEVGETHLELIENLEETGGKEVALGLMPPFNDADHAGMISAAKGGIDGPR